MKIATHRKVRYITESIPLVECKEGDHLSIHFSKNGSWKHIGKCELLKIKPIKNNQLQIKYRSLFLIRGKVQNTVQKIDLPGGIIVQRTRVDDTPSPIIHCDVEIVA